MSFHPPMVKNQIRSKWSQAVRKTVLDALRLVVEKTPVDTGHARMNWYPSFGQPDFAEISGTGQPNMSPSMDMASIERFEPVFLQNNVPYIGALEYGSSKQARNPDGMVRRTILEMTE